MPGSRKTTPSFNAFKLDLSGIPCRCCTFMSTAQSLVPISQNCASARNSKMRYQNWDILVFPDSHDVCKIPLQEFKAACHVIQDPGTSHPCVILRLGGRQLIINIEWHHQQNGIPSLLPTVTSFIPGLPAGAPFRISIHSWHAPEISRLTQQLAKPTDTVVFEARLFIDGRVAG
jgi:hypothetical protein